MNLQIFKNYLKPLLLFKICLILSSCNSDDDVEIPSLDNDFLGKDYFYYQFDGMEEYECADRIVVDTRQQVDSTTNLNLISGPNSRSGMGELGIYESEDFSSTFYFWLPINESQIQNIDLPFTTGTTNFIGFPNFNYDNNLIFQLSMEIYEEDNFWRSLDNEEWSNFSSEDFEQKNYNILENISLIDSSDVNINIYKIEGIFRASLNYQGTNLLKTVDGKYRIEVIVYK
jgi:hypothetical protein